MAKLHFVKKAAKAHRGTGVKKGNSYWWFWTAKPRIKGARGRKIICKSKPARSAYLSSSPFIKAMLDLEDRMTVLQLPDDTTDIDDVLVEIADDVREVGSECQSTIDNMQVAFPDGCPTMEMLESRVSACETIADALEAAAGQIDDDTTPEQVEQIISQISWEYE